MKFKVENIEACEPVNELLTFLQTLQFRILQSRISDYHFNELYFLMDAQKRDINDENLDVRIDKIGRHSDRIFFCECHWSIVELSN